MIPISFPRALTTEGAMCRVTTSHYRPVKGPYRLGVIARTRNLISVPVNVVSLLLGTQAIVGYQGVVENHLFGPIEFIEEYDAKVLVPLSGPMVMPGVHITLECFTEVNATVRAVLWADREIYNDEYGQLLMSKPEIQVGWSPAEPRAKVKETVAESESDVFSTPNWEEP